LCRSRHQIVFCAPDSAPGGLFAGQAKYMIVIKAREHRTTLSRWGFAARFTR
jgi:hypothetical protein